MPLTKFKPPTGRIRVVLSLLAGLSISCSSSEPLKPVHPASGQVYVDGKPAAGALVVFHPLDDPVPNALNPRAFVQADGTFTLSTHNVDDGAPLGQYAVTVHWHKAKPNPVDETGGPGVSLLPARYADPKRSNLKAQIVNGPNQLPAFRLNKSSRPQ